MKLATGIYTPAEAAALLHERPRTVRRWAFGDARPPLTRTELPEVEGERAITFVELVELLYVQAFRRAGVSLRAIREASAVAARLFGADHPFALRQVYADAGSFLYGLVGEKDGSAALVELRGHGQQEILSFVRPYLTLLDFDRDDLVRRWWPMGRGGGVVVDPAIAFGAPPVEEAGIRTATLARAFDAEHPASAERTVERVAWTYEVEPRHVETALAFRRWLGRGTLPNDAPAFRYGREERTLPAHPGVCPVIAAHL